MIQKTNNNYNNKIFITDLVSFELQYMLDGDKKIFMANYIKF